MNLFILRWNPNISSYKTENHLELIEHIKNNEQPKDFNWSIREYQNLKKNDIFILQQVGTENDGIAMIGKFQDVCYEDDSWREDGSKLYYANLWIMDAFDCNKENPLPAKRYEQLFPQIQWHGGHSGVVVDEGLDDNLINEIEKDLINAGIWKKGDLDKFMFWDFTKESAEKDLLSAKEKFLNETSEDNLFNFISCLLNSKLLIPMHVENDQNGEKKFFPMILTNDKNEDACPIFSNEKQFCGEYQEEDCEVYDISILLAIEMLNENNDINGFILDPFTKHLLLDKEMCNFITHISSEMED